MNTLGTNDGKYPGDLKGILRGLKSGAWPYAVAVLASLVLLAAGIIQIATNIADSVDYSTINGSFQTYNPVRRLLLGQLPFRDYVSYLGLGPTYLVFLAMLHDPTFHGSIVAAHCLTAASMVLMCLTAGYFSGLPRAINVTIGITAVSLVFSAQGVLAGLAHLQLPLEQLYWPGNSILSLRAVWPFLNALLIIILEKRWQNASANRHNQRALAYGMLGGAGVGWSNDYGIASLLALFIVYHTYSQWPAKRILAHFVGTSTLFALSASASVFTFITLLTGGHFTRWFYYNIVYVPSEQFWYYLGSKVLTVGDIPWSKSLICSVVCLPVLCTTVRRTKEHHHRLQLSLLFYLLTTTLLAFSVTTLGGHIDPRYYVPAGLVTFYTVVAIVLYAARHLCNTFFSAFAKVNTKWVELACCACVCVACIGNLHAFKNRAREARHAHRRATTLTHVVCADELGGCLSNSFSKVISWGRHIARELQNVPAGQRILSTYSSGLDVVSGALQPSGYDYVIHALGPESRRDYLAQIEATAPPYATTVRPDFNAWEYWIRRANWPVYRHILGNYVPIDRTNQSILWRKHDGGILSRGGSRTCDIVSIDDSAAELLIAPSTSNVDHAPNDSGVDFVELEINYSSAWHPNRFRHGGLRRFVSIVDLESAGPGRSSGAPLCGNHLLGLELLRNSPARISISVAPRDLATLSVATCRATIVADRARMDDFQPSQLQPASHTDDLWKHGIGSHNSNRSQFIVSDIVDIKGINVGRNLEFAGSGRRTITGIERNRIEVDIPLDPEKDGYPHIVRISDS